MQNGAAGHLEGSGKWFVGLQFQVIVLDSGFPCTFIQWTHAPGLTSLICITSCHFLSNNGTISFVLLPDGTDTYRWWTIMAWRPCLARMMSFHDCVHECIRSRRDRVVSSRILQHHTSRTCGGRRTAKGQVTEASKLASWSWLINENSTLYWRQKLGLMKWSLLVSTADKTSQRRKSQERPPELDQSFGV